MNCNLSEQKQSTPFVYFTISAIRGPTGSKDQRTKEGMHSPRPHVVHANQGLKVGLHTTTILGGNSHLSWCYDRGAIKEPEHTGTSKGISQTIKRCPIRKFLPNYANVYVTIQNHALSAGARTHYATAKEVRNELALTMGSEVL